MNDPVRSREERTMEELHNCDVVFVVSPAGQFLNRQDLDLMGRLTYKGWRCARSSWSPARSTDSCSAANAISTTVACPMSRRGCAAPGHSGQQHPGGGERHQSGAGYAQEPTGGAPGKLPPALPTHC